MDSGQWTAALYRRLSPSISLSRNPVDSTGEIWTKQCNFHTMKINHVEKESNFSGIIFFLTLLLYLFIKGEYEKHI